MRATHFRIQNFRSIDDSGWIPLHKVTALVGRNESGKSSLLQALHKFNPATENPYDAQREFPRHRYTREYVRSPDSRDWPVCSVRFAPSAQFCAELDELLALAETEMDAPENIEVTRYYDGQLSVSYPVKFTVDIGSLDEIGELEVDDLVEKHLPVFIYFESYGVLDSAIWLPTFLSELAHNPHDPRVRTINAMFEHVHLDPAELHTLGAEAGGQAEHQQQKERRAILLSSASRDISTRFSEWYKEQREHRIRYQADGSYFRIWTSDSKAGAPIELEQRSKGFQWFFSFYLVFLVESDHGHKDAVLLLDEPGLHLHPTAQQELLLFFDKLVETNQILYTTHSPFMIDGDNLHRVRAVVDDEHGQSQVSADTWPTDRETVFPLQAAAGYAIMKGLFRHQKNVLVEGLTDFFYLQALSQQCAASGREALPDDVYVTPCGGTKYVGHIASLFLGQDARALVILDADDAGRARRDALLKELYATHESSVLMLDEVLGRTGEEVEIEDLVGEELVLRALRAITGAEIQLDGHDGQLSSLPSRIKDAAARAGITLPDAWKATVARHLVSSWAENGGADDVVLDRASRLFTAMNARLTKA
ncbi:MAG: AAA family ATPase [Gammaproteobacteria bacterium]|nr:AAA family ATPase [Gammaproteobacteria bacterium]